MDSPIELDVLQASYNVYPYGNIYLCEWNKKSCAKKINIWSDINPIKLHSQHVQNQDTRIQWMRHIFQTYVRVKMLDDSDQLNCIYK